MKLLLASLVLISSSYAIAGNAGYFSRTCVSSTQRTVLTILNDYTADAPIYTLVIDGAPAVYNLKDKSIKIEGDDGVLTISKNGVDAFQSDFNAENGKLNLTVYVDPRSGSIADRGDASTPFTVSLQCKDFWPNP